MHQVTCVFINSCHCVGFFEVAVSIGKTYVPILTIFFILSMLVAFNMYCKKNHSTRIELDTIIFWIYLILWCLIWHSQYLVQCKPEVFCKLNLTNSNHGTQKNPERVERWLGDRSSTRHDCRAKVVNITWNYYFLVLWEMLHQTMNHRISFIQ